MTRPDHGWEPDAHGVMAAVVAGAARAVASQKPDPVIADPFAEVLVRAAGSELYTRVVDGSVDFSEIGAGWFPSYFGIRSKAFDDFAAEACRVGIRQVVLLAPGLDCRAYRLDWPAMTVIFEVDEPAVIDSKHSILSSRGATTAAAQHHYVRVDPCQHWPTALQRYGFDETTPTAWVAEGALIRCLSRKAQARMLDAITALSARASRIAAEYIDMRAPGVLRLLDVTFAKPREDPAAYLDEHRWITYAADLDELFHDAGRPSPVAADFPEAIKFVRFLRGVRT